MRVVTWEEKMVTSIVLMTTADRTIAPDQLVPDGELEELGRDLATRWRGASISREPPSIWMWEVLVERGLISLAGLVAIVELDVGDSDADKNALRQRLKAWIASSPARNKLQVAIVWATQIINVNIETLASGVSESKERYGRQDQGRTGTGQGQQDR